MTDGIGEVAVEISALARYKAATVGSECKGVIARLNPTPRKEVWRESMSRYTKRTDGEGFTIRNREVFKLGCCDCGLVHNLVIHVRGRKRGFIIGIAAERNERATAAKRRAAAIRRGGEHEHNE